MSFAARSADLAAPTRRALDDLGAGVDALVARTMAWSDVNSGSRHLAGLARMADILADAFAALPGPVERIPLAPTERVTAAGEIAAQEHGEALRIRVRPAAPIQIALTGHYDTVFPADHPFQTAARRADGALHGPGVADMKGGLNLMLAALTAFETLPEAQALGYEVLLSPDEEIGSPASTPLLAALGARAHAGMTYEPALPDGALVSARKGSGNFSLVLRGRAAHVGRAFDDGRSAIVAAADAALRLHALNGQHEGVTVNVGAIDGGGPTNIVPDRAVVRFNIRAPDAEAEAWARAGLDALMRALSGAEGIAARLHGGFSRPPKPLAPPLERLVAYVAEAGAALGLALAFRPSGGVCEGNNLTAAGCPTIDTLGPCGGALHSEEEFALADSFAARAQLSLILLHGFASGRFDARALRA
ncbi:MAG: hydrolase [Alphaproteobacteria bacterium]|nr:hydrolase [Alphaproteobacteria bacterium]